MKLTHVIESQQFTVPLLMELFERTRQMERLVARGGTRDPLEICCASIELPFQVRPLPGPLEERPGRLSPDRCTRTEALACRSKRKAAVNPDSLRWPIRK